MNYQMKRTLETIQKVKNDLSKLKNHDIDFYYQTGLGYICSSPYF